MSVEPERLFSGAKITITDRRNRLGGDMIEALECLKSWFGIRDFHGDNERYGSRGIYGIYYHTANMLGS
jgi:hypothetical protein